MRDYLCNEEYLNSKIKFNDEQILKKMEKIYSILEDVKNGVQRYPKKNEEILLDSRIRTFQLIFEVIRAQYSNGANGEKLEKYYIQGLDILQEIGLCKIGFVNTIQYVALGILLEIPNEKIEQIIKLADKEVLDDIIFDFFASAYGLSRRVRSTKFQKENPYKKIKDIIEIAVKSQNEASAELVNYVINDWLKGHADFEWTTAHKRPGYVGLWSFEAAAIAKIFNLDDSKLKDDNHYPYDLAHYKNNMTFKKEIDYVEKEINVNVEIEKFIPENKDLEEIVPNEFRDEINQLLVDFSALEDKEFWEKYNLIELWYTVDDYKKDKNNKEIIGSIVINQLVDSEYILQLDYKEEIEDYVDSMKNYWKDQDIKLVRFELDNDQYYYAKVPISCKIENIYEVNIYE